MTSLPEATYVEPEQQDSVDIITDLSCLSDADARDLSNQQISQLETLLRANLFWFSWFIFGFQDLIPSIHGRLNQVALKWGTPGWERIMIQIPREHFKTSMMTMANSLWQYVRDPNKTICIYNEKLDNAAMWVRTIREVISSSQEFQVIFRDHCPPGIAYDDTRTMPRQWKWSDYELALPRDIIAPEVSITAMGLGAASAGRHWHKIIKDDLISEDAMRSPSVMQTAIDWFDKSQYLERPALKGWDLINCTPWAYEDLYAHVLRKFNYKLYRRSALEDTNGDPDVVNGESIFPTKLTTAELQRHYNRDPFGFSSQMQCIPRAGRDQSFQAEWDRFGTVKEGEDTGNPYFHIENEFYDPDIVSDVALTDPAPQNIYLSQMSKVLLFDPAPSEQRDINRERFARNAIIAIGIDAWGRKFVLESWADRLDLYDIIFKIFDLLEKWGTDTIAVEEVAFSKLYRHILERESERQGLSISVLKLKPGKLDKDTRIRGRIGDLRSGLYYFNRGECGPLMKEKDEYPYGSVVDCLDAWSYDDKVLQRPEAPQEYEARMFRQRGPASRIGSDPITGY